jgi:BCD family chlorophyll transporter-like MFS transporter
VKPSHPPLSWLQIVRLGLVQACLGAIVVLVTSTLNRVMVVEYALPAVLPGVLVALHYVVQLVRPRFGHGADRGGRGTSWILGGMALLGAGSVSCAVATISSRLHPAMAALLAIVAYAAVGMGVGAAGTSLLALLAKQVEQQRRAVAATIMWVMMIAGFAVTSSIAGHYLDPFSPRRLLTVMTVAALAAFGISCLAVFGIERHGGASPQTGLPPAAVVPRSFRHALAAVWGDSQARGFAVFIFISMLAYSAQELLLEPFAGLVLGATPGGSAQLAGLQNSAVLAGMIVVAVACSGRKRARMLRRWTIGGCVGAAVSLVALVSIHWGGATGALRGAIFAIGFSDGVFAVSAIASMMELAQQGAPGHAGLRMGVWGAAQAIAFAVGGLLSTTLIDAARLWSGSASRAFAVVFCAEAVLFLIAAHRAARIGTQNQQRILAEAAGA